MRTKILIILLVILYLLTRLYNLTLLPIFFDEANYIFWAKRIFTGEDGWFLPLSGGKNILLPWLFVLGMKVLQPANFLFAARFVSVAAGLFSVFGTFALGKLVTKSRRKALLAALVYVFVPLSLFHERMALYDSLFCAGVVWSIYFTLKSTKSSDPRPAVLWGVALGLTHLAKATAIFFSLLTPVIFLIYSRKIKFKPVIISFGVSQLIANFFFLSSGWWEYQTKALDHTPGMDRLIASPLRLFSENLELTLDWLITYLTLPILILAVIGLIFWLFNNKRLFFSFLILIMAPVMTFSFFGREYFPRYLTFITPLVAILAADLIGRIVRKSKILAVGIVVIVFLPMFNFDFYLWVKPEGVPFPAIDKWQYVSGFPSGYGLTESIGYLKQKAIASKKMTIVTEGSYSHYPNAYHLYFWQYTNVEILERWPLKTIDGEIVAKSETSDLYIVFRDDFKSGEKEIFRTMPVEVIKAFAKPGGQDKVYLTKLK